MAVLIKPRTEGAHWYTPAGEPVHTRPNIDGGEHATNLKDARKLHLFPSVTNYLSILAKHGLEKWKITQVLLAMKRNPQKPKEAEEVYFDRVVNTAFDQVDVAAAGGSGVHQAIMAALQGRVVEGDYRAYIDPIFAFFDREGITCQTSEQTIVNHEEGFAGTMDFAGFKAEYPLVLDWKTRRTKPGKPIVSYEGQPMQVAAYGATYWATRWPYVLGGNMYISSTEPGRIELIPYDMARMAGEWEAFKHVANVWRWIKGYDPRTAGTAAETEGPEIPKERFQNVVISEPTKGTKPITSLAAPAVREGKHSAPTPSVQKKTARKAPTTAKPKPSTRVKAPRAELTRQSLRFRSLVNLTDLLARKDLSKSEKSLVKEYIKLKGGKK